MKKNNNKGFTLVELLAVVVILLAISVIAITSISAAIERNKRKQDSSKINVIISYAKLYYDQHKNISRFTDLNDLYKNRIFLSDLDLADSEGHYSDGDPICGYVQVNPSTGTFEFKEAQDGDGVAYPESACYGVRTTS